MARTRAETPEPTESTKIRKSTLKKLRVIAALQEKWLLDVLDELIITAYEAVIDDDDGTDESNSLQES